MVIDNSHISLNSQPPSEKKWPDPPKKEAYYGLVGDIVRTIEPHSEADPVALLIQALIMFGNIIGKTAYFVAEADKHYLNIFSVIVGATAKARKGTSFGQIRRLFESIDSLWSKDRIQSGLSSGEGLIWAVRDPIERTEPIKKGGRVEGYQQVKIDSGILDKRLLDIEAEFASTLRVIGRDGNTLSALVRQAWETGTLRVLTKNSPAKATGAHISIIGHITKEELLRYLDRTETANGFANRFLWPCVRRSKSLPDGGQIQKVDFGPIIKRLSQAISFTLQVSEMKRDDNAKALWHKEYERLSKETPGLLGALTARAEPQVMRLACIYALYDCSDMVRLEHLQAALALWDYVEASVIYIFGDNLGDPIADTILSALRLNTNGLSRTEISGLFKGHAEPGQIPRALDALYKLGIAYMNQEITDGRPKEIWRATAK